MMTTPRSYFAAASRYPVGHPQQKREIMKTMIAMRAVTAAKRGDYDTARRALAGLRSLGDISEHDLAAIVQRTGAGDVTPERAASIARTISTISSIAGSVVQIIALAVGGDVGKVLRWVDAIIRGNAPPEALSNNDFINFCRVWQSMSSTGFTSAATSAVNGVASLSRWDTATRNNVNLFVRWTAAALDSVCREVGPSVPSSTGTDTSCAGVGVSPQRHGLPNVASSCCPQLVLEGGLCKHPPSEAANTPTALAFSRWRAALLDRRQVEVALATPGSAAAATAQTRNAQTATELCSAETALLELVNPLPAWGSPPSEATLASSLAIMNGRNTDGSSHTPNALDALVVAGAFSYMPPSTKARCFIRNPPPEGCTCGSSSSGGGGGVVAIALPALALLWYAMK